MRCALRKHGRTQRGQNLVEITLLLPMLLLMLLGSVEVGWWIKSFLTVSTAAREGARFGSRGLHLPTTEIAEVTEVALDGSLPIVTSGADANTTIIVTQVDVDPDGSYVIYDTHVLGDLVVSSRVCLSAPCGDETIDLSSSLSANVGFNANAEMCLDAAGCTNDLVIVEIFYNQQSLIGSLITTTIIPNPVPVYSEGVMRVLVRRGS